MKSDLNTCDFSILVDAGGFSRGSDPFSQLQNHYLLKGMSWLNYSALNLGYREWNNKISVLKRMEQEIKLDLLCANVSYKDSTKSPFQPFVIKELHPSGGRSKLPFKKLTVALVGLTDNLLAQLFVNRPGEAELLYRDPVEVAKEIMPGIKGKADVTILLYYGKFQKMKDVIAAVPGFNVAVLGGESYLVSNQTSSNDPVITVTTPSMGKYVGILTLEINKKKQVVDSSTKQVPLKEDMEEDSRFIDLVAEFEKESQKPRQ